MDRSPSRSGPRSCTSTTAGNAGRRARQLRGRRASHGRRAASDRPGQPRLGRRPWAAIHPSPHATWCSADPRRCWPTRRPPTSRPTSARSCPSAQRPHAILTHGPGRRDRPEARRRRGIHRAVHGVSPGRGVRPRVHDRGRVGSGRIRPRRSTSTGHSTLSHGSAGSAVVPADATLAAEIDKRIDLGLASPRLQGHAAGTFDLVSGGGRKAGNVRLTITPPQLGDVYLGAVPPAVALVRTPRRGQGSRSSRRSRGLVVDTKRSGASAPCRCPTTAQSSRRSRCRSVVASTRRHAPGPSRSPSRAGPTRTRPSRWDVAVELPLPAQASAAGQLKVEVARAP